MNIENYLESTYLKTSEESNLSNIQIKSIIKAWLMKLWIITLNS